MDILARKSELRTKVRRQVGPARGKLNGPSAPRQADFRGAPRRLPREDPREEVGEEVRVGVGPV